MNFEGFIGGSATPLSKTINTERTINLYQETDPGTPKTPSSLIMRPALVPWTYIAPGPVRALFMADGQQSGRMFGVSGGFFYEIAQSRNVTTLGQVETDANPATISTNGSGGNQLFITSGGLGYIYNLSTGVFEQILDAEFLTPTAMGMYFETYFLNLQRGTNTFQLSAILDGLSWNGLDTGQCSLTSDQKFAMALTARTIMFAGAKNIEPWYNSGNASFPIQPESGVVIEHGVAAPYSFVNLDNTLYWLGRDANGSGIVWRFNGYTPERVSTHPMENIIRGWQDQQSVLGFCFQFNGHAFYCLYYAQNDTTLVYDISTNTWVEWARWDEVWMRWFPLQARCAVSGWGETFVGASDSGCIYKLSMTDYADETVIL